MRRREFVGLLSSAAAWPVAARGQQSGIPVVGFLNGQSRGEVAGYVDAFRLGLMDTGIAEGRNVVIEYGYGDGQRDKLKPMALDFVRRGVSVIVTTGGTPVAIAAKSATATIPIVFAMGGDPVELGLVASLNQPGGNATGSYYFFNSLGPKRVALLLELVPTAKVIGYLVNPTNPSLRAESEDMLEAARGRGLEVRIEHARDAKEIEVAFANFATQGVNAIMLAADVSFITNRDQLVALAKRYSLPASYHSREIVDAGGLMSYGPSQKEGYRQAGIYAGRILKGEKPSDLPVIQSTEFDFTINLTTAKALGLTIPPSLLARADEVIE